MNWSRSLGKADPLEPKSAAELEVSFRKIHAVLSDCDLKLELFEAPTPIFERQSFLKLNLSGMSRFPIESTWNRWGFLQLDGVCELSSAATEDVLEEISFWTHYVAQRLDGALECQLLKKNLRGLSKSAAAAVHEVRNPLTSVKLQVYLMKKALANQAPQTEGLKYINHVLDDLDDEVLRVGLHLEDLALISQFHAGQFSLRAKTDDLSRIVRETVTKFDRIFSVRSVKCTLFGGETPLPGLWDAFRVEQVLSNLLSNAWKYGLGRPIHVQLESKAEGCCRSAQPCCEIRVRDEGRGISKSEKGRIFEGFFRTEEALGEKGTGLGLYVSKKLVSAMGGKILVKSEPGHGSEFTICLPRALETQALKVF